MAIQYPPTTLFTATAATTTLEKKLWPSTLTVTLPVPGAVAPILASSSVVGGVLGARQNWGSVFLDFAGVGAADLSPTVEIGYVNKDATLCRPLASVSLKSITTAGTTTADINPFTGEATASTTWRLFDLTTITANGDLAQVLLNLNGTENNTPSQLIVATDQLLYLYVIVTSLGTMTKILGVVTPQE